MIVSSFYMLSAISIPSYLNFTYLFFWCLFKIARFYKGFFLSSKLFSSCINVHLFKLLTFMVNNYFIFCFWFGTYFPFVYSPPSLSFLLLSCLIFFSNIFCVISFNYMKIYLCYLLVNTEISVCVLKWSKYVMQLLMLLSSHTI